MVQVHPGAPKLFDGFWKPLIWSLLPISSNVVLNKLSSVSYFDVILSKYSYFFYDQKAYQ